MSYNAESIEELSFLEGVRRRVQMYLGSDDIEGTYQAFKEIINNSTDEAIEGYGNKIEISVNEKDNSISVRDYGRGVPFLVKQDGTNILVDIYSKAHVGGKFSNKGYGGNVSGLNGIGGSCVCLSSLSFDVKSFRDKTMAEAKFSKGVNTYYKESKTTEANGTYVYFIPDKEVFKNGNIGFTYSRVCQEIKDISFLYKNLTFIITNENTKEKKEFCAKNGIIDFVKEEVKKPLHQHIIAWKETDGQNEIEIAFQWGAKRETAYTFVNGLRCPEHGVNLTGAKSAITKTFNNLSGENFESDNIRHNLFYVMNFKIVNPSFANQTKSKINSPCARTLASKAFTNALKEMKAKYGTEFEAISVLLKRVEKADAAAEKARNAILSYEKKETENKKKKIQLPDKFKDCEKHGEEAMLVICEGNSALAGLLPARDVGVEALYAVRGKVKNLLKHPLDECLENQEVSDIIMALGCGIQSKYNSKKLNYGKVAIAVDADSDGFNIMCLISTLFWVLMPDFIKEGRLCWLRAPLYHLTKNNKRIFAYNDEELKELKKKYPDWSQGRMKGLGEMTAEDMELSMMNKKERRLEVLTIRDIELAKESIEMLMGTEVEKRRDFLFENVDFSKLNN